VADNNLVEQRSEEMRLDFSESTGAFTLAVHAHRHVASFGFFVLREARVAHYLRAESAFFWKHWNIQTNHAPH
jgi:hypothetical protein